MNTQPLYTSICIIGAGPAGAALAIFLGKEKIHHTIIDSAGFPRDKICGDGLDLKAITMLNHIDASILETELQTDGSISACWGFRLIHPKGSYTEFVYKPKNGDERKPPYAVCKRFALDNILVEKFNTTYTNFLPNTKATKIEKTNNKWHITTLQNGIQQQIICDVLVGADGDHSVVLKTVGERKINRNHYAGGLRQYWKGIEGIHPQNLMEVYYPKDKPMSYFWIFPMANGLSNVGYGMLSAVAAKQNRNIRKDFEGLLKTDSILKERFKNAIPVDEVSGWGLPLASLRRTCFGDGWLLVGDAASMVSPTTGEGVGTGMQTGYIAAKFIKKAVELNRFDETIFKNYDREIYRRMNDDIKLFNISMWFGPKMMGWVMNHVIKLPYFNKMFQQKVGQWLHTAYNKTLTVNID